MAVGASNWQEGGSKCHQPAPGGVTGITAQIGFFTRERRVGGGGLGRAGVRPRAPPPVWHAAVLPRRHSWALAVVFWLGYAMWWGHPGAELGCFFLPPWPWCAPGGDSQQVGWSGEARGTRGGAPGGSALTFASGRAAGAVFFFRGVSSEISDWIERAGSARPGPAKNKKGAAVLGKYGLETAQEAQAKKATGD
jgi:hypothetical protein